MIKILHFVHALTRGGGLANFIMNYYRNIDRTKVQFDFIYFREVENSFISEIESLGGRCYKFTEPSSNLKFIKEAKTFFMEHKNEYTAIHCHALFATATYGPIAKKHGIKHVISHAHSTIYGKGFVRQIRNYIIIRLTRIIATDKMACSKQSAEFMYGKKAVELGKVAVINNAIDCNKYIFDEEIRNQVRSELGIGNELVLGHVGGFSATKNHTFILDVLAQVVKQKPDTKMMFIGGGGLASGSTYSMIKEKTHTLGLDNNVLFLGVRTDVNRLLMAMDVFLFPSVFEGLPISLVEAQASGLRCIVSSNVTNEVNIGLCEFLDLSKIEFWCNAIMQESHHRENVQVKLKSRGFDVNEESRILQNMYLSFI